jgi:PTH1 family peptidyl-tRNA hydrolase
MLILAGLGNPEPKYAKNRHNIGFAAMQVISLRWNFGPERAKFAGLAAEGQIATPAGPVKALTLRPATYYNDAGREPA